MVKLRGALVGIIYRDMLTIRAESKNSSSAMTLMSTDVDRICSTARWVVDMVPNIAQVGIALWILSLQLGAVSVAPVVVALLCTGGSAAIAKRKSTLNGYFTLPCPVEKQISGPMIAVYPVAAFEEFNGVGSANLCVVVVPIRQRKWIAAIQKRVGITSEILGTMKGVKLSGVVEPLSKQLQSLRDFEISESRKFRKLQIMLISMS
jgi:ATP-binding cassette, subfamily C (CFTR/MRP), member 1